MDKQIIMQGWECPKCGAVMSPTTRVCVNCNGHTEVIVNCNSTNMKDEWIGISPEARRKAIISTFKEKDNGKV